MKLELLTVLVLVAYSEAARILAFFPLPMKSHHYVFRPIIAALGRRGHQVVYYTGYPYEGAVPPGVEQVDISQYMPVLHTKMDLKNVADITVFDNAIKANQLAISLASSMVGNPPVQKLIHSNQKFDAVLMESYILQEYQAALIHKFGAVGIEILPLGDSSWMNELAGLPSNPAYQLDYQSQLTPNMNFWQRLYNAYVIAVGTLATYYNLPKMQNVMDQYFNYTGWESRPPIGMLLANRSLILTNSHYIVGYPVPMASNRVEIGGVNIAPKNKPLPKDIQTFMDESQHGVIYFSLGSNINTSNPANEKLRESFMKVFEELPQRVLMKWEVEYTGKLPKNVKLEKWLPQQDVLAHKNCALFITHGGYLSLIEAVNFAVPVIGIPFYGDQAKNFYFVEQAGIGKMLRYKDINYETAFKTINEVLSNRRYKDEMTRRSKILRDKQQEPADKAVYWIEHAIKYPNVLTSLGSSLTFVQLHLIDLQLFIIATLSAAVFISWKFLAAVASLFRAKPKPKSKKVKRN